jgi:glycosyltransferase involved in cell wall biosynthesis
MACGTPVLTSRVCSLPEVVGDAAVLVNPNDIDEIADGIKRLVQNCSIRVELKEKSLRRAREFTWDETARKTKRILQLAISSVSVVKEHAYTDDCS